MTTTRTESGAAKWAGVYTLRDAARIAGVEPRSVRRWALGYDRRETGYASAALLQGGIENADGEDVLSFQQLVEVMFIGLFRTHGVSVPVIRAVAQTVSARYGTRHPFAIRDLQTDGRTIFSDSVRASVRPGAGEAVTQERVTEDLFRGQVVIREFAQDYFRNIEYGQMEAERYWPLGKEGRVVIDPGRYFGNAIDHVTGVPTLPLYGMYRGGETPEKIADWYMVDTAAVIAAIRYETSLRRR